MSTRIRLIIALVALIALGRPFQVVAGPKSVPQRQPVEGRWLPTILPPNDLTDPPQNYPHCEGGACFGMASVIYALWCCGVEQHTLSLEATAARVVHILAPDNQGKLINHRLPSHVLIGGKEMPLHERSVLIRLAEAVQNAIQPGGGKPKPPKLIKEIYRHVQRLPSLDTPERLKQAVAASQGRQVVGMLLFNEDLTHTEGHAVILTLEDDRLSVWDPNAKMSEDAQGSGKPTPLKITTNSEGKIERVQYKITLPDGRIQQRQFQFIFPATTFLAPNRMPAFPIVPALMDQAGQHAIAR